MFTRAKKILASELMYALAMDEDGPRPIWTTLTQSRAHADGRGRSRPRSSRSAESSRAPARGSPWRRGPKAFVSCAGRRARSGAQTRCWDRATACVSRCRPGEDPPLGPIAVAGGAYRSESVRTRLRPRPTRTVVVHDAARPLVRRARACVRSRRSGGRRRRDCRRAGDRHGQGSRQRPSSSRTLDRAALWSIQTPQVFRARSSSARSTWTTRCWAVPPTTRRSSRRSAGGCGSSSRRRPTSRSRCRTTCDAPRSPCADRLPRPPAPGRAARTPPRASSRPRTRSATASRGQERGIAELGVAEHIYRFHQALEVWDHPFWRAGGRRPRPLLRVRARGDRPEARDRGRLRGRSRGPDGDPARGPRLGLRRRLRPLCRATSRSTPRNTTSGFARDRRACLEALLRDRSPRLPRAGSSTSSPTPTWSRSGAMTARPEGDLRRFYYPAMEAIADRRRARGLDRGLRKPVEEIYPAPAFLEMAVDAGTPLALSSDAHGPTSSATIRTRVELLDSLGVEEIAVFEGSGGGWSRWDDLPLGDRLRRPPARGGPPAGAGRRHLLSDRGLTGHSDADVLTHAVIDALLGAAALGDIGHHFPDTDAHWKDAARSTLLTQVSRQACPARLSRSRSSTPIVQCEAPRLGPYRDRMRIELARALGSTDGAVNVKWHHRRDGLRRPRRGNRGAGRGDHRGRGRLERERPGDDRLG